MELVKPPTDNLYKFIALSGLALALYCSYTIDQISVERINRLADFTMQEDLRSNKIYTGTIPWMPPTHMLTDAEAAMYLEVTADERYGYRGC